MNCSVLGRNENFRFGIGNFWDPFRSHLIVRDDITTTVDEAGDKAGVITDSIGVSVWLVT